MSIPRAAAANYLDGSFAELAAAIGQTSDGADSFGYGWAIDAALRTLGTAESDLLTATVDDVQRDAYYALCDYYTALRIWRALVSRPNLTLGDERFQFEHQLNHAHALLEDAATRAKAAGYPVGAEAASAGAWAFGELDLGWAR